MEDKIQALTDKIYHEGVAKAKAEAEAIVEAARQQSHKTTAEAEKAAKAIVEAARKEADELRHNVAAEIRLSAGQAVSSVKQKIASLITLHTIHDPLADRLADSEFIGDMIMLVLQNWPHEGDTQAPMRLLLAEDQRERLEAFIQDKIHRELQADLQIDFSHRFRSGFRVGPLNGNYLISFTEEDFANFFQRFLRPKTAEILYGHAH